MTARQIFEKAIEIADATERMRFVESECEGDEELRDQVLQLLEANVEAGSFMEGGTDANETRSMENTGHGKNEPDYGDVSIGMVLGDRYELLENIGEGGMGSVWVAKQKEPVKRKVAVKLVKAGMDSKQVLARFESERQALAVMDHPNIAKIFDGGMTPQGRPFFVMEYVKGIPFTEYCDQARLSLRERLELFIPVCQAIQHAHHKGIVHRDLKPSNILICLYDGHPIPKVIDFGLAKALHHSLTDCSIYTAHGMMLGTPIYMSPEQAEFNNLDIDTRTDIYSLGVVLYELLTGTTPIERQQFHEAAFDEVLRIIREVEPARPSLRLSGSESLPSIAAQRRIEPRELQKSLSGDLDWIVMKALDKERSRRYETANSLSRDIERFLTDEAIEARPPNTIYRLQKFFKKNWQFVGTATLLAIVLLLSSIVATRFGIEANIQRDKAQSLLNDVTTERDAKVAALQIAEKTKSELQLKSYVWGLNVAQSRIKSGELSSATEILNNLPKELRGWEWNVLNEKASAWLYRYNLSNNFQFIAVSPTGDYSLVSEPNGDNLNAMLLNSKNGDLSKVLSLPAPAKIVSASLSRNAKRVFVLAITSWGTEATFETTLFVWDREQSRIIHTFASKCDSTCGLLVGDVFANEAGDRVRLKAFFPSLSTLTRMRLPVYNKGFTGFAFNKTHLVEFGRNSSNEWAFTGFNRKLPGIRNTSGVSTTVGGPILNRNRSIESAFDLDMESANFFSLQLEKAGETGSEYQKLSGTKSIIVKLNQGDWYKYDHDYSKKRIFLKSFPDCRFERFYDSGKCGIGISNNNLVAWNSNNLYQKWRIAKVNNKALGIRLDEVGRVAHVFDEKGVSSYPLPGLSQIIRAHHTSWVSGQKAQSFWNGDSLVAPGERVGWVGVFRDIDSARVLGFGNLSPEWFYDRQRNRIFLVHGQSISVLSAKNLEKQNSIELDEPAELKRPETKDMAIDDAGTLFAIIHNTLFTNEHTLSTYTLVGQQAVHTSSLKLGDVGGFPKVVQLNSEGIWLFLDKSLYFLNHESTALPSPRLSNIDTLALSPNGSQIGLVADNQLTICSFPGLKTVQVVALTQGSNKWMNWGMRNTIFVSNWDYATVVRTDLSEEIIRFKDDWDFGSLVPSKGKTVLIGGHRHSSLPLSSRWKKMQATLENEATTISKERQVKLVESLIVNSEESYISPLDILATEFSNKEKLFLLNKLAPIKEMFEKLDRSENVKQSEFEETIADTMDPQKDPITQQILDFQLKNFRPSLQNLNSYFWKRASTPHVKPVQDDEDRELFEMFAKSSNIGLHMNTVGVVFYRLEEYPDCIKWLMDSTKLNQGSRDFPVPRDSAFLCLANFKLGNEAEAKKYLGLFKSAMQINSNRTDENLLFEKEVEEVFGSESGN